AVPYVAAHAIVTVPLALVLGVEATTWATLWVVVTLLAIVLGGAVGLWCSAAAASSWRSLLMTLVVFYCAWLVFVVPVGVILIVLRSIAALVLQVIGVFEDTTIPLAVIQSFDLVACSVCLGLALGFWLAARGLLAAAVKRVGRIDRTLDIHFDYF